jgi:hypothetical protein
VLRFAADRREQRLRVRLRHDPGAAELVLSPHWDDAVLSCWSVLTARREVHVVNVFAGVPPPGRRGTWEQVLGVADTAERARRRIAEDARALSLAGREPVNLPLLDSRRGALPSAATLEDLDRELAVHIQRASRVYVPAGIGAHLDHRLVRRYGRALLRAGMPVALYAELPYCVFHGWPAWVTREAQDDQRDADAYWRPFLAEVAEMPPLHGAEVERLDGESARAKAEAIACYEASLNHSVRRLLADRAIHGFEVRWTLQSGSERRGAGGAPAT